MRRLGTAYSMHYKNKYGWVGSVTQGRYSASRLFYDSKLQPIVAACYVERNALDTNLSHELQDSPVIDPMTVTERPLKGIERYPYSSFQYYFNQVKKGQEPPSWLDSNHLLNIFSEIKSHPNSPLENLIAGYKDFVDFVLSDLELSLEDVRLMYLVNP